MNDEWMTVDEAIRHVMDLTGKDRTTAKASIVERMHGRAISIQQSRNGRSGPYISRADVLKFWPQPQSAAQLEANLSSPELATSRPASLTGPRRNIGGRPAKYDWPLFAGFAAHFIAEHDPERPSELVAAVLKRFEETDVSLPDQRNLERFCKQIFEEEKRSRARGKKEKS